MPRQTAESVALSVHEILKEYPSAVVTVVVSDTDDSHSWTFNTPDIGRPVVFDPRAAVPIPAPKG